MYLYALFGKTSYIMYSFKYILKQRKKVVPWKYQRTYFFSPFISFPFSFLLGMIFICSTFVEVDGVKNRLFDDGATPLPIWEPHYCLLLQGEKRFSHHRTEKVFVETNLKRRNYWGGGSVLL